MEDRSTRPDMSKLWPTLPRWLRDGHGVLCGPIALEILDGEGVDMPLRVEIEDPGYSPAIVAAVALRCAAFGPAPLFAWGDVDRQNARAEELELLGMDEEARPFRDLADRIASLLPPREP